MFRVLLCVLVTSPLTAADPDFTAFDKRLTNLEKRLDAMEKRCSCPDQCPCGDGLKKTKSGEKPHSYAAGATLAEATGKPLVTFVGVRPSYPDLGDVIVAAAPRLEGYQDGDVTVSRFEHGKHVRVLLTDFMVTTDEVRAALRKPFHSPAVGGFTPRFVPASFGGGTCSGGVCR